MHEDDQASLLSKDQAAMHLKSASKRASDKVPPFAYPGIKIADVVKQKKYRMIFDKTKQAEEKESEKD